MHAEYPGADDVMSANKIRIAEQLLERLGTEFEVEGDTLFYEKLAMTESEMTVLMQPYLSALASPPKKSPGF